jgi:hypothetical protein
LTFPIVFPLACTQSNKYVIVKYSAEPSPPTYVIDHGRTLIRAECGWTQGEDEKSVRIISQVCEAPKVGEAINIKRFGNELHYETANAIWVVLIVKGEETK